MDQSVRMFVEELTRASDAQNITFPQLVQSLLAAGVERYHADLMRSERIYYMQDGNSCSIPAHVVRDIARDFSATGVEAAVRAAQRGDIQYREFCRHIAAAGCVGYFVTLAGRRAVYYGRTGETHIEHFPASR
jgi:uncharacterized protein YbcV (DUF1398 family)